ncbi:MULTISPECIES: hypothetical protein [Reichenbachiella]|uniref:hypothetical protein n=1 Tax=Reichenbachiella TaxID=156993 RepID=UPI000EC49538|nr:MULTISPECIES: hypothetical protein [Reichenbachiella]MBU2912573.1 hypothetical protein [Reichenbachiella agariperforans]RJE73177.1 hypothetical protein BGP76_00955 [Reichenbachiella sp. MSK19-1]
MGGLEKIRLDRLLDYKDENVISRFTDTFDVSNEEAEDILKETLKFLYICHIPGVFISDDILMLDEMWHNMILFTPEYHRFSQEYFSKYLHHLPAKKSEKEERKWVLQQKPENAKQEYLDKLQVLISITYDHLGEETVKKWFQEYPQKYSKEKIKALRK